MEIKSLEDAYKMAYRDGQIATLDSILKGLEYATVNQDQLVFTLSLARGQLLEDEQ